MGRFLGVKSGAHLTGHRSAHWTDSSCRRTGGYNIAKSTLAQSLAIVRFPQIKHGTERNDAVRVNLRVRHVVMTLDMIEIDGIGDARLLIQIHQITLQIWVIDNSAQIALEMAVINRVEPNKSAKKPPVRLDNTVPE